MKIKKAVIPVAGLGTRFLPVTKTVPKELLPIVDKPILLFIVQEALSAGIDEIVLIQGPGKKAIEDFFEGTSLELEAALKKAGRLKVLEELQTICSQIRVINVRQAQPLGLGHAILMAQAVVGEEPFAVLLGDEIMMPLPGHKSGIGQLCDLYYETGLSSVAVMDVADADVSKYGIVDVTSVNDGVWRVGNVIEKPSLAEAPSRLGLPGRYVFDSRIFGYLENAKPGKNQEIQLTDSMAELAKCEGMLAKKIISRRFDAGDKLGFLQANVEMAAEHPELGAPFKKYLIDLVRSWS